MAIKLVKNDTGPQVQVVIADETTGLPVDLTGATAVLKFRKTGSTANLFSRQMTITNATKGIAVHGWLTGDLSETGSYEAEIEVTFSTGERQTVYRNIQFTVKDEFA